jgi:hypothetical protein
VAEKWRVCVILDNSTGAGRSSLRRYKRDLAREMQERTGAIVVGTGDSGQSPVFAYTPSRAAAEAAAQLAWEVTGQHGLTARVVVEAWRPVAEKWEDASTVSERDLAEERDYQQREDRRVSAQTGVARWRVRVELRTHRAAVALAQRLSGDGHQVDRGRRSVMARADSEEDARRLAEVVKHYAPSDAEVLAERADTPEWSAPFLPESGGPLL